jgi:hypothetical protein
VGALESEIARVSAWLDGPGSRLPSVVRQRHRPGRPHGAHRLRDLGRRPPRLRPLGRAGTGQTLDTGCLAGMPTGSLPPPVWLSTARTRRCLTVFTSSLASPP